jgi:DNA-binding transcriptional LysR family regulator
MHARKRQTLEERMKTHKDVHLRQLDYFLVAAETESFTEAAAKLSARGVSVDRSMVGRQIGDLEDFLGVDLFDDTGRSIKLNDAGRAFAKDAEQLLTMFSEAVHALRTQAPNSIADLQLGFARTPTLEFRKKTTLLFDDIAAPCRVLLHDLAADACKRNLLMGELHVAFVLSRCLCHPMLNSSL